MNQQTPTSSATEARIPRQARVPTETRIQRLSQQLDQLDADAMLITNEINVRYLSGFTGDSSYLLVQRDKTTILSDRRYETQIASECPTVVAAVRPPSQPLIELSESVIKEASAKRLVIESADLSLQSFRELEDRLPGFRLIETDGLVETLRMVKDAGEIEIIRRSTEIAQRAFQSVTLRLTPRWTEREIAFELEAVMRSLGADGVSFAPIVGAQPSGALPHYRPGEVAIGDAPSLLIDWGASYAGYASDLTRTLHRDRASDAFRRGYEAVLQAQLAAIDAIQPGVSAQEVDAAARDSLVKAGLGDAFKHGLGHGIGLQIHEAPRLSSISEDTLQAGMVVTVEPGVYFEGEFGIRIEDDVLVTDAGCEVLSTLPKGLDDCRLIL